MILCKAEHYIQHRLQQQEFNKKIQETSQKSTLIPSIILKDTYVPSSCAHASRLILKKLFMLLQQQITLTLTPTRDFSSPRKGRGPKMGVPPWIRTGGLSHHNVLSTPGTPLGSRCRGSDFVPIWYPLLWHNGSFLFFTFPCWILLDWGGLGLKELISISVESVYFRHFHESRLILQHVTNVYLILNWLLVVQVTSRNQHKFMHFYYFWCFHESKMDSQSLYTSIDCNDKWLQKNQYWFLCFYRSNIL